MRHLIYTFFSLFLCLMPYASQAIDIKVSQVTLTSPTTVTNNFTQVTFRQTYAAPPLVFVLPSSQGVEPASIRIRNVTTTGFEAAVFEPTGANGSVPSMTFDYIAVSAGVHTLPDGTIIEAGTLNTANVVQSVGGSVWSNVLFTNLFAVAPTLHVQIQTTNNEPSIAPGVVSAPWLTAAATNITTTGFQAALERSQTSAFGAVTVAETMAYLAFPATASSFADNATATITYQTQNSTNSIKGHDNGCFTTNFTTAYLTNPISIASKITRNGSDGGWLRRCALLPTGIGLYVDEDTSVDAERAHIAETASIISFSQPFDLSLTGGGIEAGSITTPAAIAASAVWTHVTFPTAFSTTPLIFALPTSAGTAPASLRLRNINASGFDIAAFEPLNETGSHPSMTVSYLAIIPGTHLLPNGDIFEAGTITTAAEHYGTGNPGTSAWATLAFTNIHPVTPAVITQIQTINNEAAIDPVNVSIPFMTVASNTITTSNMQIAIERSEAGGYAGPTVPETIAYLAVANTALGTLRDTSGVTISYESIRSANTIRGWDNGCFTTAYVGTYLTPPIALANKATLIGGDGGWLRECSRSNLSIGLTVDEDRALNTERSHTTESANILIFDKAFEAGLGPLLNISKVASLTSAMPGQPLDYTVTVSNVGNSIATTVTLTDLLSPYTALVLDTFGVGTPFNYVDSPTTPSGLTMGAATYSQDNGATFAYVPATAGSDGTITNWKILFTGNMNAFSNFSLTYQVVIK